MDITGALTVSWSMLKMHANCHESSYLVRGGKRSKVKDIRVFFPGTCVDRLARHYLLNQGDYDMVANAKQMMVDQQEEALVTGDGVLRWKHGKDREETEAFIVECVRRLKPIIDELILPHEYQPELRFRTPVSIPYLDGTMTCVELIGGIDVVVRTADGKFRAYDWKATKNASYARTMLGQAVFYDLAIACMFGESPEQFAFVQPMVTRTQVKPVTVTNEDRSWMIHVIMDYCNDIWNNVNDPTTDPNRCYNCVVKHACSKFQPVNGTMSIG